MISPKDAEPVCAVWLEQLDRFKVHPELYEMLFNRVIDARVECLRKNESQPTLTVDLFLAEFCKYRDDIKKEVGRLQDNDYTVSEIHQANLLKIRNDTEQIARFLTIVKAESLEQAIEKLEARKTFRETEAKKLIQNSFLDFETDKK